MDRMDPKEAKGLVDKANAARMNGAPDKNLESTFSVKMREDSSAGRLFVFRINGKNLERELPLVSVAQDKETFRFYCVTPLAEPIRT